jgi:hypothetical protein
MKTMPELDINPKFQRLLRPLSEDEQQRLEWAILKDGILDSLKVWTCGDKCYLVDGHNRYGIWQKHQGDLPEGFETREMNFRSEDEALEWIIENQLQRRNLNQNERVLYLGQLFEMRKKRRGGLARGDAGGATADQIAEEHDVSPRTVTRAAEVAIAYNEADREMQQKFASGEISQAELIRSIRKIEEERGPKGRLRNAQTNALAAVGERLARSLRAVNNQWIDYMEICKAIQADPEELAPAIYAFEKFAEEIRDAERLTTIVDLAGLCPKKGNTCDECGGIRFVPEGELNGLKKHFGLEE